MDNLSTNVVAATADTIEQILINMEALQHKLKKSTSHNDAIKEEERNSEGNRIFPQEAGNAPMKTLRRNYISNLISNNCSNGCHIIEDLTIKPSETHPDDIYFEFLRPRHHRKRSDLQSLCGSKKRRRVSESS